MVVVNVWPPKTPQTKHSLPYLDIYFHRIDQTLRRSVYRKPTHSNDHINYYSHHSTEIKSGILIGFFLRALRICTPEHLPHEEDFICSTFKSLNYPYHFIRRARRKAHKIHTKNNTKETNIEDKRRIILPNNNITSQLKENLEYSDIQIVTKTSTTIKKMVTKRKQKHQLLTPAYTECPAGSAAWGILEKPVGMSSPVYTNTNGTL